MAKRKIIIIGGAPPPVTGQSNYFPYLVEMLRDYDAFGMPLYTRPVNSGILGYVRKCWNALASVVRLAICKPFDSAILVTDRGFGLFLNAIFAAVLRIKGSRIHLSYHAFDYIDRYSILMHVLAKISGPRAVHLFLCDCMRLGFSNLYKISSNYLILNNTRRIDLESAIIPLKDVHDRFIVGFLSNVTFEKGISEFIEVIEILVNRGLPIVGRIVGGTTDPAVANTISEARLRLGDHLIFSGPLYGEEKENFLSSISVMLFPTKYPTEAQPNVLFEAMRYGTPCVSTTRGCIEDDLSRTSGIAIPLTVPFVAPAVEHIEKLYHNFEAGEMGPIRRQERRRFAEHLKSALTAERLLIESLLS